MGLPGFIVLMAGGGWGVNGVMGEEFPGVPGVFRCNEVGLPEYPHRPEGHVLQVSQRSGHDEEGACHISPSGMHWGYG